MGECKYSAQGKFKCIEEFVEEPKDIKYSMHVLVMLDNSLIYNRLYENISVKYPIGVVRSQMDNGNEKGPATVRITDNTMYEPNTPPLKLMIKTKDQIFPVLFIGDLNQKTSAGRQNRSVEFKLDRYSGFEIMFNR